MQQTNPDFNALLAADRQLIEEEHARMELFLNDLHDLCDHYDSS